MFMMSFFRIHKCVLEKLEYYRSNFFWQCNEHRKKYIHAKWSILHKPKSIEGLGIVALDIQNKCLLSKWIFKLANEEGLWQEILKKKYFKDKRLSQVMRKRGDSHFWSGLIEIKGLVLDRGQFKVQDGTQTRFLEDLWIDNEPLTEKYPSLYNIVRKKSASMAQVLSTTPLNVSFRRAIVGENWAKWVQLVGGIMDVGCNQHKDSFIWTKSKSFSVKAVYNDLVFGMGMPFNCCS
jgi:hypothetical protein